jgi:aquaporin Z
MAYAIAHGDRHDVRLFVRHHGLDSRQCTQGLCPVAVGLSLTLIHLISIPVTNTSVSPARSTGPALFVGGWALSQLWLFWLAPIVASALWGAIYRWVSSQPAPVAVVGSDPR